MHDPTRQQQAQKEDQFNPTKITTGCAGVNNDKLNPLMAIVPVVVKAKSSEECIATYAFVDNGCGAVFVDNELNVRLKTKSKPTKLVLKTLNLEHILQTDVVIDELQIASMEGDSFIDLPPVYVKDSIPVTMKDAPTQEEIRKWSHLKHIRLPSLKGNAIPHVTMMIGINVPAASTPLEVIRRKLGEPYAIRTHLGWLVYGLSGKLSNQPEVNVNFCRIDNSTLSNGNDLLEQQLKSYFNMEFVERLSSGQRLPSVEDKKFMQIMDESVIKIDRRYQLALPLRSRNVQLPNNRMQAELYASRLREKLKKNKQLHEKYTEFMSNLEKKGYAEKVPDTELTRNDGQVWYIPHHGVFHPRKPEKLRVVYNCPVQFNGVSLNSQLLQGPDMTNLMYGVLLRWREEQIALKADIESMFYQVRVHPKDCDMLRYLWWPDGNLKKDMIDYRMLVHLFGAVSSPSCANYALRKAASDAEGTYSEQVIDAIRKNFYVDNLLKSVVSHEDEAITLVKEMCQILGESGFNRTKWTSNSREVLQTIPEEHKTKELKGVDIHRDELPMEQALGIKWCVETDQLEFDCGEVDQKPTRRNILSAVSAIYDPLGICSPYVLKAKKILQSLCVKNISWDDPILAKQQKAWKEWAEDLPNINSLKLSRCLKPKNAQLHHCADFAVYMVMA
ncbi:uncharacterized protein LOC117108309 [Anneissia japonica]|uniref:uncharacterized protein LOC117108309 n=1 Tax=Anneissia japonica TaxID=1529436 RepID=UPI0014254C1D|nr:uncharacterized protein LOC117108309 [Anneissia japonica]